MCWLKRERRKIGIALAGMLLLLPLMAWLPVSTADAHEGASGFVRPGAVTVQATPTEDATVTALTKEQLTQEVAQQQHTWENWLWSNAATILSSFLSTLVIVIGALFGVWRWRRDRQDAQDKELKDRQSEREKLTEERFQSAVTGLGDEKKGAKVGAAILLRTFLLPGYEQFYAQVFDLTVAHLRFRTIDSSKPEPPDSLSQALITVFQDSFPLARDSLKRHPRFLDASRIQLGNAFLAGIDLKSIWMREAFFHKAHLRQADLRRAMLRYSDFSEANLIQANFREANLHGVDFCKADLTEADLSGADLTEANLNRSNLHNANVEGSRSLLKTNLRGVTGPTKCATGCKQ